MSEKGSRSPFNGGNGDQLGDLGPLVTPLQNIVIKLGQLLQAQNTTPTPFSWTPVDQSGAGLVFTSVDAGFQVTNNMLFAWFALTFPVTASGAGVLIGGLPYPCPNRQGPRQGILSYATDANAHYILPNINDNKFVVFDAAGAQMTNVNLSTDSIRGTLIYPLA